MQPMKTTGLIISLHKTLFDGTFDTIALLQDQAAEFNDGWIRRIGVFPQTNPSLKQWSVILKKGRSEFKRLQAAGRYATQQYGKHLDDG
jgi:hypothetical protein